MASNIRAVLLIEIDGQPVRSFPLTRRIAVDETQSFSYEKTSGAGFADVPDGQISTGQFLLLQPDQAIDVQFSDGAGGPEVVTINPGGLLLVLDGSWSNGVEIENTSGSTAVIKGTVGGT